MAMYRKRVVMLGPSLESRGGIASVTSTLMESRLTRIHDVTYIATTSDGSKVSKLVCAARALAWFEVALRSADVVHMHFSFGVSMRRKRLFIARAVSRGVPVVLHCHSSEVERVILRGHSVERNALKRFVQSGTRLVVMSDYWRDLFVTGLGISSETIDVVPNGLTIPVCPRDPEKTLHLNVLFLGRVEYEKGIDVLIDGIALIQDSGTIGRAIRVWVAGDGAAHEISRYRDLAAKRAVDVEFLGWVDGAARENLFAKADVFVLPSRREVFPMSIVEAMSRGIPCVATACGSIPDMIEDGVTGILFPMGDPVAMAKRSRVVFENESFRSAMAAKALTSAREKFDLDVVVDAIDRVYSEAVGDGTRA